MNDLLNDRQSLLSQKEVEHSQIKSPLGTDLENGLSCFLKKAKLVTYWILGQPVGGAASQAAKS